MPRRGPPAPGGLGRPPGARQAPRGVERRLRPGPQEERAAGRVIPDARDHPAHGTELDPYRLTAARQDEKQAAMRPPLRSAGGRLTAALAIDGPVTGPGDYEARPCGDCLAQHRAMRAPLLRFFPGPECERQFSSRQAPVRGSPGLLVIKATTNLLFSGAVHVQHPISYRESPRKSPSVASPVRSSTRRAAALCFIKSISRWAAGER